MINTLKYFVEGGLFSSTCQLLDKLGVKYEKVSEQPIDIAQEFKESQSKELPEYATSILKYVDKTYFVGHVNDEKYNADDERYKGLFVFAAEYKENARPTRSDMSNLTRLFNRISADKPVVAILRQGHLISIATCERTNYQQQWRKSQGERVGKVSILRGIDCSNPHRGHLDILESLVADRKIKTFDDLYEHWQKIFSTELLTQQFYNELFEWYKWVAIDKGVKISFPKGLSKEEDPGDGIHITRLATRMMFVWFIKQMNLVPNELFDEGSLKKILCKFVPQSETDGCYYNAILQNLFFATLNQEIKNRRFAIYKDDENNEEKENNYGDKCYYRDNKAKSWFSISKEEVLSIFHKVPYLNGGLFECLDKTDKKHGGKVIYYDGFSREPNRQAHIPNCVFFDKEKGLLSIFNRYHFTVEENTPTEQLVALDPELLGKVFENLLGYINPETNETARKQSGSFYTPREIVKYMVDESIVAYLCQRIGTDIESELRGIMNYTNDKPNLSGQQKSDITQAIFNCRILDPACGSGAFPMGVLQQLVYLLSVIDPDNTEWKRTVTENAAAECAMAYLGDNTDEERQNHLRDIEANFRNAIAHPDYVRKLYLIEHCIYGVDIQPIAIQISKLRFFISLVSDQQANDNMEDNYGIQSLPNLSTKFVCANSLIQPKIESKLEFDQELKELQSRLLNVRNLYFYAKRLAKRQLVKEDNQIVQRIGELLQEKAIMPDEKRISECQQRIKTRKQELEQYKEQKIEEREFYEDATLFSDGRKVIKKIDVNKQKRLELQTLIRLDEDIIRKEQNKKNSEDYDETIAQLTAWDPYDVNSTSPFFDPEWMFSISGGFDVVIGNPPYVQLQNNGGDLAKLYESCNYSTFARTGDIYCLFYERGWQLLKKDGHLCYITSNKWMRAGYGESTRKFFANKTNPMLLIDFAGVKIFESATVDTNILLFAKSNNQHKTVCAVTNKQNKDSVRNLSDFVQQQKCICDFSSSDSWVVLSPIEQSIKRKIEAAGTPLKDWDIQINYGIKTGFNEAFIISTEKRDEILSNCKTEDERKRTVELIRPILRGRDIKRYGYVDNGLYLINTHNGIKGHIPRIKIEDYPAVKAHLDQYWEKIATRADKGDTPYNLRNCAYLEDFSRPRIVYREIGEVMDACMVPPDVMINNKLYMVSGKHLEHLLRFFNSKLFNKTIFTKANLTGGKGVDFMEIVRVPLPSECDLSICEEQDVDNFLYSFYGLTQIETEYIENRED